MTRTRWLIRVEGIVQGVGFRPFVHRVATDLGISGHVGNDAAGVFIDAEGDGEAVEALVATVRDRPPPLAVVERLTSRPLACDGQTGFRIVESDRAGAPSTLISPDVATCDECLAELLDPDDRRFRYPFVNCVNCGPRFTIVTGVPYDRPATTMAAFEMCKDCRREYDDPADRRFHAQPVCCPACGPRLVLRDGTGRDIGGDDVIETAVDLLRAGSTLAVKGLGGYHLAVDATDERAVTALRSRKHREEKPFAVLCADLAAAAELVDVDGVAAELLASPQRPIVLLPRRAGAPVAMSVAPRNRRLGVLLPYTALHHLLVRAVQRPIVLTSGNVSDEPIAFEDDDALARLAPIADGFLLHDRRIHTRTDDSVVRVSRGRPLPLRRSRGYTPAPLRIPVSARRAVLGCGAELKNTFALARADHAFVSHHIGDLENAETLRSFTDGIAHLQRLLAVEPRVVAYDLHPEYLSSKWALERDDVELVGVQHHHAHIASCLADNGATGPVIGVAFDGLGFGTDGSLWGGEVLVADLTDFERVGHLQQVALPGGARAIREPWRMAVSWLMAAYGDDLPDDLGVLRRNADRVGAVASLARSSLAQRTTSVGRLFDAVAALCGVRDIVTYEGQAAVELEQLADPGERGRYPLPLSGGVLRGDETVRGVVDDLRAGVPVPIVAARFHRGVAKAVADACAAVRERSALDSVALSGGVFQNELLVGDVVDLLEAAGFRVLTHAHVPPNDGGISLGQVAVAAARDAYGVTSHGSRGTA